MVAARPHHCAPANNTYPTICSSDTPFSRSSTPKIRANNRLKNYGVPLAGSEAKRSRSLSWSTRASICDQRRPAVNPPSTTRPCPVTQFNSLLASQRAALAISAGSPPLPSGLSSPVQGPTMSGMCTTNSVGISGNTGTQIQVAVPPTQMALTRKYFGAQDGKKTYFYGAKRRMMLTAAFRSSFQNSQTCELHHQHRSRRAHLTRMLAIDRSQPVPLDQR